MFRGRFLLLSLCQFLSIRLCSGSSSTSTTTTTPIRLWEPSWVASAARGTTVAVSCRLGGTKNQSDNNCVLLLTRASAAPTVTSSLQWKPPLPPSADLPLNDDGSQSLRILETTTSPIIITGSHHSSVPVRIGSSALCAMTGLSSDVDHVTRVIQNQMQRHAGIYQDSSIGSYQDSLPMPASGIAIWLASTVRSAAKWKGGRPFGLQALLVGRQQQTSPPFVYSVDPSGAWRHWGSGCTAIGRNAEDVRQQLYEELLPTKTKKLNPLRALKVALQAVLRATKAAQINQDNDRYEAVLFWIDDGRCRIATIDPQVVQTCRDEVWETL